MDVIVPSPEQKTIMICQPFGIGDVLFVQKIILHYASRGFRVVVPILDIIAWMRHYIVPHQNVEYPLIKVDSYTTVSGDFKFAEAFLALSDASGPRGDYSTGTFKTPVIYNAGDEENSFIFLALGSSYQWLNDKLMPAKYHFVDLDFSDWVRFVHIKRRPHVERELYYDVLGLKDDSRYTFVNEACSTHSLSFNVPGNVVKLQKIDGFTFLDWALVIEKSTQIVTIDTSLVILTEVLKQKKPLYMVSRYSPPSFEPIKDILTLDWNLVLTPEELNVSPVV
jgi:hypothetical protein